MEFTSGTLENKNMVVQRGPHRFNFEDHKSKAFWDDQNLVSWDLPSESSSQNSQHEPGQGSDLALAGLPLDGVLSVGGCGWGVGLAFASQLCAVLDSGSGGTP